jgi:Domain of unknown function (DUF3576)
MRDFRPFHLVPLLLLAASLGILSACGPSEGGGVADTTQTPQGKYQPDVDDPTRETIFGAGGLNTLFDSSAGAGDVTGGGGIGVNAFLWRAALDTFAFLPPFSADPLGGVVIYDWYSPPETPNERFKVTVYILDTRLRADGIKVAVFRQVRDISGEWVETEVDPSVVTRLEDAVLTRARQIRIAQLGQ